MGSTTFKCENMVTDPEQCLGSNFEVNPDTITSGGVVSNDYEGSARLEWEGTGIFDKLVKAYNDNLRIEYDNGRIIGKEYATAYTTMVTSAMSQAVDLAFKGQELQLKAIELCVKKQVECLKLEKDLELSKLKQENVLSSTRVLERQITGFDDNLQLKLLQAQLDAYAMIYSSGMLEDLTTPEALHIKTLTKEYNAIKTIIENNKDKKYKVDERIISRSKLDL